MPTVVRSDWEKKAASHHGRLLLWINQSDDPMLKAANSSGVCHALAKDWLKSQTGHVAERRQFTDQFRVARPNGEPIAYFVPARYLAEQARYSEQFKRRTRRVLDLKERFRAYRQAHPGEISNEFIRPLTETFQLHRKFVHGKRCIAYQKGLGSGSLPSVEHLKQMLTRSAFRPSFYLMSMRNVNKTSDASSARGGHAVGVEVNDLLPGGNRCCQYLDANFGLFSFNAGGGNDALTNMLRFFYDKLEATAQYVTRYNQVELWEFGMGDTGTAEQARAAAVAELKP